jgi:hypothetical protein
MAVGLAAMVRGVPGMCPPSYFWEKFKLENEINVSDVNTDK